MFRRLPRALVFLSVATVASLLLAGASATLAGSVDPSTLQPVPPPGARCHTAGNQVICDTVLNSTLENQPDFELPCGVLYLTGTDFRDGLRFYQDGKIVRRHVTGALNVTGTLSPTGDGSTITPDRTLGLVGRLADPRRRGRGRRPVRVRLEPRGRSAPGSAQASRLPASSTRRATTRATSPRSPTSRWLPCARHSTPEQSEGCSLGEQYDG